MDVPLTINSIVNPKQNQAQLQLIDQIRIANQKAFAKKLLVGSAIWFAAVGVFIAGAKMQQVIDTQAVPQ